MTVRALAFVISAASVLATLFYGLATVGFGCHGSDASSPPAEGSVGDYLCTWPAAALHLGLGLVAVAAPVIAVSRDASSAGLSTAFAVSSGAVAGLALVGSQIQSWNEFLFLYLPIAIFLVALGVRARQSS